MIIKKKNSRFWHVAYFIRTADGKRVKRSMSTETEDKEEAKKIETDTLKGIKELREKKRVEDFLVKVAEDITSTTIQRPGLALSLVWQKYSSDHTQKNRTERTQKSKRNAWDRFKAWLEEKYPEAETINDVTREMAKEYSQTIQDKKAATFNNNRNSLSSVWQVLAIDAGLKENIWRWIKTAEDDSERWRNLALAEVKTLFAKTTGFWHVAVGVGFYTGLRFKDIVYLRKSTILKEYANITPFKTKRKGKDVEPYVHPELKRILEEWLVGSDPTEDYVFPEQVKLYDTPDFQREFGKILTACEIYDTEEGPVGFPSLRHTFITECEERGVDRKVIQGAVGHGSPVMTGHYSHDKTASKAISVLPSLTA